MKTKKSSHFITLLVLSVLISYGCTESSVISDPEPELELDTRLLGSWVSDRCTDTGGHTWTFTFEKENARNGNGLDVKRECQDSQKIVQEIPFDWTQKETNIIHYVCDVEKDIEYSISGNKLYVGKNRTVYTKVE